VIGEVEDTEDEVDEEALLERDEADANEGGLVLLTGGKELTNGGAVLLTGGNDFTKEGGAVLLTGGKDVTNDAEEAEESGELFTE